MKRVKWQLKTCRGAYVYDLQELVNVTYFMFIFTGLTNWLTIVHAIKKRKRGNYGTQRAWLQTNYSHKIMEDKKWISDSMLS